MNNQFQMFNDTWREPILHATQQKALPSVPLPKQSEAERNAQLSQKPTDVLGAVPMDVVIVNGNRMPIELVWVDPSTGEELFVMKLRAQHLRNFNTYIGHTFRSYVKDKLVKTRVLC